MKFIIIVITVLKWFLIVLSPWLVVMLGFVIYFHFWGKLRLQKGVSKHYMTHGSFFRRLFWEFPRQFVLDRYNRNPDDFREYGFRMVTGEQGKGKTVTLVYLLLKYQEMYPKLKVTTNFAYVNEDNCISHWSDLLNFTNDNFGVISVLDEVQNWFNSLESKDFPVEMLGEITQQRKQKKMILGTTQVFTRAAKPIREQTYLLYEPVTLFGCITFVVKRKPILSEDGCCKEKKFKGCFFFVHNEKIRNAYDTYKKIEKMSKVGFKPTSEHMSVMYSKEFLSNYEQ